MEKAFQKRRKIITQITIKHEVIGCTKRLHSPCEKGLSQRYVQNLIRMFIKDMAFAVQKSLEIREITLKIFGNLYSCAYYPSQL